MKIKFLKFNEFVRIPERKHYSDTGADIYMLADGCVLPHNTVVIPLGFGIDVPNGYNAHIQTRTSIAKQGIFIQQCAIDAGYKGEIHMILVNLSDNVFTWKKGDRLGYIEIYPCVYPEFVENLGEERGQGAFGSTNNGKEYKEGELYGQNR